MLSYISIEVWSTCIDADFMDICIIRGLEAVARIRANCPAAQVYI